MDAHSYAATEQHVEVHKFYTGVVAGAVVLALLLEASLALIFSLRLTSSNCRCSLRFTSH